MPSRTVAVSLVILALGSVVVYRLMRESGLQRAPRPPDSITALPDHGCPRCNLVLVQIDTLRADHLGCYGYAPETSPFIDEFAAASLLFESAYSVAPWTFPAQFSIFTARYPSNDGLLRYYGGPKKFPATFTTLAEILKSNGYRTAGYHGGGFLYGGAGFGRGFDTYVSRGRHFEDNREDMSDFIEGIDDTPFFLFLHGYNVHRPYRPPERLRTRFMAEPPPACEGVDFADDAPSNEEIRACLATPRGTEYAMAQYDAEIVYVDEILKTVFAELEARARWDRTVVVITSDHGEEFLEHGYLDHITHLFDELLRVPLIVRIPGGPTGRVTEPVSTIQITPTVLDVLRIEYDAGTFSGKSLFEKPEGKDPAREPLYALTSFTKFWAEARRPGLGFTHSLAVIDGDLKYVLNWSASSPRQRLLFDRRLDPGEQTNLADEPAYARRAARLERTLQEWREREDVRVGAARWEKPADSGDPEVREQLKALGYVE